MCKKCSSHGKCDECLIKSITEDLSKLKSPITGQVIGDKVILYRGNIIIGEIPFVYSESQFNNAFGKPLV